jgi:hypothetical protein
MLDVIDAPAARYFTLRHGSASIDAAAFIKTAIRQAESIAF